MALDDLLRTRSREQVVKRMLILLSAGMDTVDPDSFAPTNYAVGDPLRTLLELAGEGISDVERVIADIAAGGSYERSAYGGRANETLDARIQASFPNSLSGGKTGVESAALSLSLSLSRRAKG